MAWLLSGLTLEHGQTRTAPRPDAGALASAQRLAKAAADRAGVRVIDTDALAAFEKQTSTHTLYRFDVRHPLEYEAGHPANWRSAPGGQLVQATDEYVGTLHARVVLRDDDGVRARMTASWLIQLGYLDVYVLDDEASAQLAASHLEAGPEPRRLLGATGRVHWIEADHVAQGDYQVIDIDRSLAFRKSHIRGARFIAASALDDYLEQIVGHGAIVLTSEDGTLAGLVAARLASRVPDIAALLGGTRRWRSLGLPVEHGDTGNLTGDDDAWYSPYHAAPDQVAAQMNAYLAWELQLVEQVERDGVAAIEPLDFGTDTAKRSHERLAALTAEKPR
jgi:rhodanese-related sulfurtransferase